MDRPVALVFLRVSNAGRSGRFLAARDEIYQRLQLLEFTAFFQNYSDL